MVNAGRRADHVAVPLRMQRGESRRWTLPVGIWMIALPDGMPVDVEGLSCESLDWPKGRILCLSRAGGLIRVSHQLTSNAAELHTKMLLRRTNVGACPMSAVRC